MGIKIKNKIQLFISRALNISSHESKRVIVGWFLKFFLQIAIVIGSTLLIAFFVEDFSIESLPILYVIQASLAIFSVIIFAPLIERIDRKNFILLSSLVAIILFFTVSFLEVGHVLFFAIFIVALSAIVSQISIALSLFIEELFSPLESERAIPIIESSEPLGSLVAGILIISGLHYLDIHHLLFFASISLSLMVPLFLYFMYTKNSVPILRSLKDFPEKLSKIESLTHLLKYARIIPFLKGLLLLVFLYFAVFSILEFQFTKAIDSHILPNEGGHASALTHSLGMVHVIISLAMLTVQFFISSRIMKKLGVVKTIMLNPILSALSFVVMIFNFSYVSAVGAKAVFEVSGAMFKNAHQISFFSLKGKIKTHAKEFLEGISRPLGVVAGTALIILVQIYIPEIYADYVLNTLLFVLSVAMILIADSLSNKYTLLARKNLEMRGSPQEKIDAIEVLSQKGHANAVEILTKELTFRKDCPEVRAKIVHTLGIIESPSVIPAILMTLKDKSSIVQLESVKSLTKFKNLGENFLSQVFARYHVTEVLKSLFVHTRSKKIKNAIIHAFTSIKNTDVVPFLLDVLSSDDEDLRAEGVFACGLFHDPTVGFYLEKYLEDKSPKVRSNAIIALWQFVPLRLKLIIKLTEMLQSDNAEELSSGIFAVGEIKYHTERDRLIKMLEHTDENIRRHVAIALGKINHSDSIEHIFDFVWHKNKKSALKTKEQLKSLHPQIQRRLDSHIIQEASRRIASILQNSESSFVEELKESELKELLHIFMLIEEEKEVFRIRNVLKEKQEAS